MNKNVSYDNNTRLGEKRYKRHLDEGNCQTSKT